MAALTEEAGLLIKKLGLKRLEGEGGYYRKYYTHRSGSAILGGYHLLSGDRRELLQSALVAYR